MGNVLLSQLRPRYLAHQGQGISRIVSKLKEADGISFVCPKCFHAHGRKLEGVHSITCWFRGRVPDDIDPGPGRWTPAGTGVKNLSFIAGLPPRPRSVALTGGCGWHGHLTQGELTGWAAKGEGAQP